MGWVLCLSEKGRRWFWWKDLLRPWGEPLIPWTSFMLRMSFVQRHHQECDGPAAQQGRHPQYRAQHETPRGTRRSPRVSAENVIAHRRVPRDTLHRECLTASHRSPEGRERDRTHPVWTDAWACSPLSCRSLSTCRLGFLPTGAATSLGHGAWAAPQGDFVRGTEPGGRVGAGALRRTSTVHSGPGRPGARAG